MKNHGNFNFLSLDVIPFFLLDVVVVAVECYMITYLVFLLFLVIVVIYYVVINYLVMVREVRNNAMFR